MAGIPPDDAGPVPPQSRAAVCGRVRGEHPPDHGPDPVRLPQGVLYPRQHVPGGGGRRGPGGGRPGRPGGSAPGKRPRHPPGLWPGGGPDPPHDPHRGPDGGGHAHLPAGLQVPPGAGGAGPYAPGHSGGPGLRRAHGRVQPPVHPAVQSGADQRHLRQRL